MITEQEAIEAAKNIPAIALLEMSQPVRDVMMWATRELSRRESERSERAKPIDAEWCLANGAERSNHSGECRWVFGSVNVYWQAGYGVSLEGDPYERIYVREITTRGQLLDLLAALKGGAT